MDKKIDLSRYRYSSAIEELKNAKLCFENNSYRGCVNRSYYAAFYAIRAILALGNIDFKSHKSVINHFNKEYVGANIFPRDLASKLGKLKNMRDTADYSDFLEVSREDAKVQLESVEYMIPLIDKYLSGRYEEFE